MTLREPFTTKSWVSDSEYIESNQASVRLLHHQIALPQSPKINYSRGLQDEVHSMFNQLPNSKCKESKYSETSEESEDPAHIRSKHAPRLKPYNANVISNGSNNVDSTNKISWKLLYAFLELHKCDKPNKTKQQNYENQNLISQRTQELNLQISNNRASSTII